MNSIKINNKYKFIGFKAFCNLLFMLGKCFFEIWSISIYNKGCELGIYHREILIQDSNYYKTGVPEVI